MERRSGILMHITSLPGAQGCGTIGREAYAFADFLSASSQSYWQILPTCPVDETGSPYHSVSARAGCHLLIDLEPLVEDGTLTAEELSSLSAFSATRVDYPKLSLAKDKLLRTAYMRSRSTLRDRLCAFYAEEASWLSDYALFMALHEFFSHRPWHTWDEPLKHREGWALDEWRSKLSDDVGYHVYVQYLFFTQWQKFKEYTNNRGIRIIGDLPIYVAEDSADVWANQQFFELDEDCRPSRISGCPPDAFSPDGQLWNNPLYRWDILQQHHYSWWIDRLRAGLRLYDVLRLDHFRGFEAYWAVDRNEPTAKNGCWAQGPGMDLFRAVCWQMGIIPVIAEDLGFLTDGVAALLRESGFPGMRVLEFAFDKNPSNPYLPHNYERNCVAYTGTHDNNTVLGWADEQAQDTLCFAKKYLGVTDTKDMADAFLRTVWASAADLAIAPIQDFLGMGADGRMNMPGTVGGNWSFRISSDDITAELADKIRELTHMFSRNP